MAAGGEGDVSEAREEEEEEEDAHLRASWRRTHVVAAFAGRRYAPASAPAPGAYTAARTSRIANSTAAASLVARSREGGDGGDGGRSSARA
jgi:hypothetical protein